MMKRRLHRGGSEQDFQSALAHERRVRKADISTDSLDYYTRQLIQRGFGGEAAQGGQRGSEEGMLFESGKALNTVGDPKHSAPAVFMSAGIRINLSSTQPGRRHAHGQADGEYSDAAQRAGDDFDAFLNILAQAEGTDKNGVQSHYSAEDLHDMYGAYNNAMSDPMAGYPGNQEGDGQDFDLSDGGDGLGEEDDFGAFPGDDDMEDDF